MKFVIIAPESHEHQAAGLLRSRIEHALEGRGGADSINASIGFALGANDGEPSEALIARADKAMYAVKQSKHDQSTTTGSA